MVFRVDVVKYTDIAERRLLVSLGDLRWVGSSRIAPNITSGDQGDTRAIGNRGVSWSKHTKQRWLKDQAKFVVEETNPMNSDIVKTGTGRRP